MMDKNNKSSRRNRNRGRDKKKRVSIQYPDVQCKICSETITDVSHAIALGAEGEPAHFDCVLKKITAEENIKPGERVIYLGSGHFGVIQPDAKKAPPFTIIKNIAIEEWQDLPNWRREIKTQLKR